MNTTAQRLVPLQARNLSSWGNLETRILSASLPFYFGHSSRYVHRPRSGAMHFSDGRYTHTSLFFWCGGCGFPHGEGRLYRPKGQLLAEPPAGAVICATCEGRARGAGQLGTREICGREVRFSPRGRFLHLCPDGAQ